MKKDTKKRLGALIVILIFGMSSLAFIIIGIGGQGSGSNTNNNEQLQDDLQDYIVEYELDSATRQQIISAGFTLVTYYYTEEKIIVDLYPKKYSLNTGQPQIIVEKIKSDKDSMTISSSQNTETIDNLTDENIFNVLCRTLSVTPLDCVLAGGIGNNTEENSNTNNTNETG